MEEERKKNAVNNSKILEDIDIDKLLSDDLIRSSKMTRAEIMSAMEELKGGFELISLYEDDCDDSDYDEEEDEQVCDMDEDKNITTLQQEIDDAVNASSIAGRNSPDEPEEEIFDNDVNFEDEMGEVCWRLFSWQFIFSWLNVFCLGLL